MPPEHLETKKDNHSLSARSTSLYSHLILWAIVLFIIIFYIWAKNAVLDEVAVAEGKVVPSSQVQIVQNLEGGIVQKISVHEGDMVEEGQILMTLSDTLFLSKFNELQKKLDDLQIELTRLEAEINNVELSYSPEMQKNNPELIEAEMGLYNARKNEKKQLQEDIQLASQELDMTVPLVAKGAVSRVEVLRLKRTVSELQGKFLLFNSKTMERYNEARGEFLRIREEMRAAKDRVMRTVIRSPVKGIIKQAKVNTIGGVIKPGMDIFEIVPVDDTLLIEAKLKPDDIGFVHRGQKTMVKISAFDFSIYGGLKGEIEQISADTIIDEEEKDARSYFIIRVRTSQNYLGTEDKPLYIIPGMQATVDIKTGKKTVLDYLLKPLLKTKQKALRER